MCESVLCEPPLLIIITYHHRLLLDAQVTQRAKSFIMAEMQYSNADAPPNPLEPAIKLRDPSNSGLVDQNIHPLQVSAVEDSAVTKAEKFERHGSTDADGVEESPSKRRKIISENETQRPTRSERQKGVAPIKPESVSSTSFCT